MAVDASGNPNHSPDCFLSYLLSKPFVLLLSSLQDCQTWIAMNSNKGLHLQAAHLSPLLLFSPPTLPIENRELLLSVVPLLGQEGTGRTCLIRARSGHVLVSVSQFSFTDEGRQGEGRSLSSGHYQQAGQHQARGEHKLFYSGWEGFEPAWVLHNMVTFLSLRKLDIISGMLGWNFTMLLLLG